MPDLENTQERIISVLRKRYGVRSKEVSGDSIIATDLGVDGDDAVEFLQELEGMFAFRFEESVSRRFWPESGIVFDSSIEPISVKELASIVAKNATQQ